MGDPYTSQAISGYNSNPPPDDGSTGADNEVDWSMVKTKLGDPIKALSEAINTAIVTGFGKVLGGVGVTSSAVDYTVLSSDQGKLVRATASGITITTPDATNVGAPFVFALLNNSSSTITFDGNGSQTIDGAANSTIAAGAGMVVFTDGTNWFTTGQQGLLVGKQLQSGDIINATIVESNAANAVTFALKTLAGNDPSSADPILVCFRNATTTTGNYVYRQITAANSLVISSGSTMGTSNSVAFRVWLVLFDDGGTIRMGAINCVSGTTIYPLAKTPIGSSTAEGGAGAADSAQVFYTGSAVTSKPYVVLGYATYNSGLATAGSWNVDPILQLFNAAIPLPGSLIQEQGNSTGAVATGTTALPSDDTIPQSGEGDQYMTQAITPVGASNILVVDTKGVFAVSSAGSNLGAALFQDSTADALTAVAFGNATASPTQIYFSYRMKAGTTSSTTFKLRAAGTAGTTTFNGTGGNRLYGGVMNSYMRVREYMA